MKETELRNQDTTEIVNESQIQKQRSLLRRELLHPGQKCWELEVATGDIHEAEYKSVDAAMQSQVVGAAIIQLTTTHRRMVIKKGCMYITSINKKNAARKFIRALKILNIPNNIKL